jgi:UDP:flavonoid glycosyltransferase YjiC (YdhE family)
MAGRTRINPVEVISSLNRSHFRVHPLSSPSMPRILFAALGSLGDLHPVIAVAVEMRERGHDAVFCTSPSYRDKIEDLGFEFHPLRPDLPPDSPEGLRWRREIMDAKTGTDRLLRGFLFPNLRATYEDLARALAADRGADLLVSGEILYAAPILAEKDGLRWASCHLAPISFFSAFDLPILPPVPGLSRMLRRLGPGVNRQVLRLMKRATRNWSRPARQLRAELGLTPGFDPIYEAKNSPQLALAMFSSVFAQPMPDWPPNTSVTGFCFYDRISERNVPELNAFLAAGDDAPIIFTLGSAAVFDAGNFYEESARAARLLKRRAVLLVGPNTVSITAGPDLLVCDYLPYSEIFPAAAAVVHQGGIGTTAQALRAGCPMLLMPYSHDQPDNAERLVRPGVGRTISRQKYSAEQAAFELNALLTEPEYKENALKLSRQIRKENGAVAAAIALERLLNQPAPLVCAKSPGLH